MKTNQTKSICRSMFEVLLHRLTILDPRASILLSLFLLSTGSGNASGPFSLLQGNIWGQSGTTSYTDNNAASLSPLFYRVGVGP